MSKIIYLKKIIIILLVFLLLGNASLSYASFYFADSFSGGFNEQWLVNPNSIAPVPSTRGITAASNSLWSDIMLPLNENTNYNIQFKLYVNTNNINSAWRLYLINESLNKYKIINNWGPNNLLQISEAGGVNSLYTWAHEVGSHQFNINFSPQANTPIQIIEDGTEIANITSMTDFNASFLNIGMLGFNDYEISDFTISTNLISVTPTPTQAPSPTPTPTPTTPPTNKIVFIPGVGASVNMSLLLTCQPGTGNEEWTLNPMAEQIYTPIMQQLQHDGFTILPLYYDWRRFPNQTAAYLASRINQSVSGGEKVHVLGHSMGGLVARAYVEQTQENSKIDAMLTVGSPHKGSVDTYVPWASGELPGWLKSNLLIRFQHAFITNVCPYIHGITALDAIHQYGPSAEQILPTFPYLVDQKTNIIKPINSMFYRNTWLPNTYFPAPFFGIRMGTLSGYGQLTLDRIDVMPPNAGEIKKGLWKDGKPTQKDWLPSGDGTVLQDSAILSGSQNMDAPLDHNALMSAPMGTERIRNFFENTPLSPALTTFSIEPTSALVIMAYPANFSIETTDGAKQKDKSGMVAFLRPTSGIRKIHITPTSSTTILAIAQFLDDGTTLWKNYTFHGKSPIQKTLLFDKTNPKEDPLVD